MEQPTQVPLSRVGEKMMAISCDCTGLCVQDGMTQ